MNDRQRRTGPVAGAERELVLMSGLSSLKRLLKTALLSWSGFALVLGVVMPAEGQPALPAVSVALTIGVRYPEDWLRMHGEVLNTPPATPKPLVVTISARTRSSRSITLLEPKFSPKISGPTGTWAVTVLIKGKIPGAHASEALLPFLRSLFEQASASVPDNATLEYGLTALTANLIEVKVEDR